MDCKDLMVGDWVSYCGFYNKVIYIGQKVSMYDGKGTEFTTDPEHIRPIPLTEEILVKNGFDKKYFDYDFSYDLYEDDNVSFVRLYDHGEGVFFTETSGGDILIKYVHQLQHLLRLCGIEKEIKL